MPKSKGKRNAYYYFMLEWKKQEESKGRHFPNGIEDVRLDKDCSKAWENLSNEDKACYKEKEKNLKMQSNNNKKTCNGESVAELKKTEEDEKECFDNTKQHLLSLFYEAKKNKSIQKLKFFVIHVNYFYYRTLDNNEVEYYPAEIAIAEFCLEEGITRIYHKLIRSKIQMGYTYEASEHSKNTHQIPINEEFGEADYNLVNKEISDFLKIDRLNGEFPILFTRYDTASSKYPVMSVLKTLSDSNITFREHFKIYPFEELFANLYNVLFEENTDRIHFDNVHASLMLKRDPFDYKKSTECEFHKNSYGGGNHCSKSLVQRWIFILFSHTCDLLGINLRPKFHIPQEYDKENQSLELDESFANMSLNTPVLDSSITIKKNTGPQKKRASERTSYKKQHHKSMAEPLIIIDHSKVNEACHSGIHISKKESQNHFFENTVVNIDEDNFPSLGRDYRSRGRGQLLKSRLIEYSRSVNTVINTDENDFPSLGRGFRNRR